MKNLIKKTFRKFVLEITRCNPKQYESKCITLKSQNKSKGNVLLSYTINTFLSKDEESFTISHTYDWECFQIAQTFVELGYNVDVISYCDKIFTPTKNYLFFIDVLSNMERIAPLLNRDCVKIFHSVYAHWLFHNSAEYQRYSALKQRKGIFLKPIRLLPPNSGVEYADYIIVLGNDFTVSTYSYAQKPIYRIPISTQVVYPWPEEKNYESCRNNFIWFGGNGLVHKGLDLILDVFSEMPDYHLYVCGPIQQKEDFGKVYDKGLNKSPKELYKIPKENAFEKAYYNELYQTPNIHVIGWVDVSSPEFIEIAKKCIGVIYPSCSEGCAGSVVNCMHAGLVPIISFESGVDVNDFGVILQDCSIDTIKENVRMVSRLPVENLKQMSRDAWEFARANYTRERFAEEYRKIIEKIINGEDKIIKSPLRVRYFPTEAKLE